VSVIEGLKAMGSLMVARGLVAGPGGNTSARDSSRMICTPSGYDVDHVADDEWSIVDLETGKHIAGPRPTSEWELHLKCLRARPETGFVCHAHPPWATGLVCGGAELLPFTPDFIAYVDRIAYLPFTKPSSTELAVAVEGAVRQGFTSVSLANHGFVTLGRTWREAYAKMIIIEDHARLHMAAILAGKPRALSDADQAYVRGMEVEAYRRKVLRGE